MSSFYRKHYSNSLICREVKRDNDLIAFFSTPWRHRKLIAQLCRREIVARYKGSLLGLIWLFVEPLLMLAIYSLFLGIFLKARWGTEINLDAHPLQLPLTLFIGLNFYNFFSESLNKSSGLMRNNVNYIKKIIFPIEILPWAALGSSIFYALIAFSIWAVFHMVFFGFIPLAGFCLFLLFIPMALLILGCMYFISALNVYLKDITPILTFVLTALMFLSPVFYSVKSMSPSIQWYLQLNPLTLVIEQARACLLEGRLLDWNGYCTFFIGSLIVAVMGYKWFQKTREGFADVL